MLKILEKTLNIIIPHKCMLCNTIVDEGLCSDCWGRINFISEPVCQVCGVPFEYDSEHELCSSCIKKSPAFDKASSVFLYDEFSRPLITKFKYSDNLHFLPYLAKMLNSKTAELKADFIVPVPMHYSKMIFRKYNQSALLAKELGKISHRYVLFDGLIKTRNNPPQASLARDDRKGNVKDAFNINPKRQNVLKGKNILLVDDVMTTGSTISECAKLLKSAGAVKVFVATLSRTSGSYKF